MNSLTNECMIFPRGKTRYRPRGTTRNFFAPPTRSIRFLGCLDGSPKRASANSTLRINSPRTPPPREPNENQRRQRKRDSHHADGNLRYKHALPSSVDRRIRRKGKDEVVAKQLAMLMGESYDLPLQKRGRKEGYRVPCAGCAASAGPAPSV